MATEIAAHDVRLQDYPTILDVRPPASRGRAIAGSTPVAIEDLLTAPSDHIPEPGSPVLVVCDLGVRSRLVAERLESAGYPAAVSLLGGLEAWRRAGREVETTDSLTEAQLDRYDRHIKLPEIGVPGQRRIGSATVGVVGAGGLGAPVLAYLAGAGVGCLRIVDHDAVEVSNLHRQTIYRATDSGQAKTTEAARFVTDLNPEVTAEARNVALDDANAVDVLGGCDVVVDATDRFPTRYAVSDAAQTLGIPAVIGAVYRWEGQLAVLPPGGPCYRCLFPQPPDDTAVLDCAITGVVGSVVGTIGSMQATEALKAVTGTPSELTGRMLMYDGRTHRTQVVGIARRSGCRGCDGVGP